MTEENSGSKNVLVKNCINLTEGVFTSAAMAEIRSAKTKLYVNSKLELTSENPNPGFSPVMEESIDYDEAVSDKTKSLVDVVGYRLLQKEKLLRLLNQGECEVFRRHRLLNRDFIVELLNNILNESIGKQ